MEIRELKEEDLDKVYALGKEHFALRTELSWDWSLDSIKKYLIKSFGFGLVSLDNRDICGFVLVNTEYSSQRPEVAWLTYILTSKKYQRQKIGSKLLDAALMKIKEFDKTNLIVDVYSNNAPSINFFNKNNFKIKEQWVTLEREPD